MSKYIHIYINNAIKENYYLVKNFKTLLSPAIPLVLKKLS